MIGQDATIGITLTGDVDGRSVAGSNTAYGRLHRHLHNGFPMNDLGELTNYTEQSIEHYRNNKFTTACQEEFIDH